MANGDDPADLKPATFVRLIHTADGAILLDIEQGICFSLNPTGIKIWEQLQACLSLHSIAKGLANEFHLSEEEAFRDISEFVQDLREKHLLGNFVSLSRPRWIIHEILRFHAFLNHSRSTRIRSQRLLPWKAFFGLLFFDLLGLGNDFPTLYTLIRNWSLAPVELPTDAIVERVCLALRAACIWYPKRVMCLQKSAITTCLLRSLGIPANMALGAQIIPFTAHAWTEVNGQPVGERHDVQTVYHIWERL